MPSRAHHHGGRAASRASFSVIAAIFLLLSTSLAVGVANQLHQLAPSPAARASLAKYLVVFVLDGAEPSYFHLASLPHVDALRSAGIEYDHAWAGILESETPAGHATINTGSTPARDGLLGFNWVTGDNDAVHIFDPNVVRQGAIEQLMQASGAATIASLFKARFKHAKVMALSGHKYYAADPLGGPDADYIVYYNGNDKGQYVPTGIPGHMPPASLLNDRHLMAPSINLPVGQEDTLATKLAITSFQKLHQRVTLINVPEFDWPLGHIDGGDPSVARKLMLGFDHDLGMLENAYQRAGVLSQTEFVITADHGMAPLKHQIPDSVLDNAVTQAGASSVTTTYSTAGYIWLNDPSQAQVVANNVTQENNPYIQSVYYRVGTGPNAGYARAGTTSVSGPVDAANQYLLSSFQGGNAPDVVALCKEDASFVTKGAETWKGNHGGAAWQSQHVPLIMSGPGVSHGVTSHYPARLEDVAPTALALFGIKARNMQGSVLANALTSPAKSEVTNQRSLGQTLSPLVQALISQSKTELASRL